MVDDESDHVREHLQIGQALLGNEDPNIRLKKRDLPREFTLTCSLRSR